MRKQWKRWWKERKGRAMDAKRRREIVESGGFIDPGVRVFGWSSISVGKRVVIGEGSAINAVNLPEGETRVEIGDCAYLGRYNYISAGGLVRIGGFALVGPFCEFLGTDHRFEDPLQPYVHTGCTAGGQIYLGVNSWLGSKSILMKGCRVGHGSVVAAGAIVTKEFPAFCILAGNPARILKRYCFERREWVREEEWKGGEGPTEEEYLGSLMKEYGHKRIHPGLADASFR